MDPVSATVAGFAAREAFGRLAARIAVRGGSFGDAEDALAEALAAALVQWPRDGVPRTPEAWLLTVARRRLADDARRGARALRSEGHLALVAEELGEAQMAERDLPDERLRLMFACTHPAIDRDIQAPLMLQMVLGLTAAEIADAFMIAPNTMGVRLSRAKTRIREAAIGFDLPAPDVRPARVASLLEAIYIAFTRGAITRDVAGSEHRSEALWLARLVTSLQPEDAGSQGLLAIIAYVEARHAAGRQDRHYVPLDAQDTTKWDTALIAEAEAALTKASRIGTIGRYQIEAAIHSVHADRARTGRTDWPTIIQLYETLLTVSPSLGASVARAAALLLSGDAQAAHAALEDLDAARLRAYAPYWAVRAEVYNRLGQPQSAAHAWQVAAGLAVDPAERNFLLGRWKTVLQ